MDNSSVPSVGVHEFALHPNSLPCNIHRVTFENVKQLFGQSEAEKLGRSMTMVNTKGLGVAKLRRNPSPNCFLIYNCGRIMCAASQQSEVL